MEITIDIDNGNVNTFYDGNKYKKYFIIVDNHRYMELYDGDGWAVYNDSSCDTIKSFPRCFCDIKWNNIFSDQKTAEQLRSIKSKYIRRMKLNEIEK